MTVPVDEQVVFRPWRVRWLAWIGAIVLFGVMVVVAVLLREVPTGVHFRLADQVALVLIGLLMALGMLLLAMPRVIADANGVRVRNVLVTKEFGWDDVLEVGFPDGAPWARLELPDDEYLPMLAVQAVDKARAVTAIRALRALHAAHAGSDH
ncbi:PH domain-containing protein [Pseudonocardia acaciae]|uniref:PH domain-containing protein n=1 Tax=Pseudonocardia acaciae TaxID=551276 RepID=UPI00048B5AA4